MLFDRAQFRTLKWVIILECKSLEQRKAAVNGTGAQPQGVAINNGRKTKTTSGENMSHMTHKIKVLTFSTLHSFGENETK